MQKAREKNRLKTSPPVKLVVLMTMSFFMFSHGLNGGLLFAYPALWKITAYCQCEICTNKKPMDKLYGITASGKKAEYGMVACNFLPFGTKIKIDGLGVFKVQDRGSKRSFGIRTRPKYHLDVYMTSHSQAKNFGVKYLSVEVLK
jgi:3D (Asp-Asp-Asp) domain-containing protein